MHPARAEARKVEALEQQARDTAALIEAVARLEAKIDALAATIDLPPRETGKGSK
jgi:hypothetical protein